MKGLNPESFQKEVERDRPVDAVLNRTIVDRVC